MLIVHSLKCKQAQPAAVCWAVLTKPPSQSPRVGHHTTAQRTARMPCLVLSCLYVHAASTQKINLTAAEQQQFQAEWRARGCRDDIAAWAIAFSEATGDRLSQSDPNTSDPGAHTSSDNTGSSSTRGQDCMCTHGSTREGGSANTTPSPPPADTPPLLSWHIHLANRLSCMCCPQALGVRYGGAST